MSHIQITPHDIPNTPTKASATCLSRSCQAVLPASGRYGLGSHSTRQAGQILMSAIW